MKKYLVALLALGAILAVPSMASAATEDSVTGTNARINDWWDVDFNNVQRGPNAENATGTVTFTHDGQVGNTFAVECMRVDGNTAYLGYASPTYAGQLAFFIVRDNGLGTYVDQWATETGWVNWTATCNNPPYLGNTSWGVFSSGDVVVTDGQPQLPDTDGDGTIDAEDSCRSQPGPESNHGCPVPDADGDGVADAEDVCPNRAGPADNNGCPEPVDSDGDGVFDDHDQCPAVVGSSEYNGCQPPAPTRPTSKEDAKANWALYGFKNQGQAVAWWNQNKTP